MPLVGKRKAVSRLLAAVWRVPLRQCDGYGNGVYNLASGDIPCRWDSNWKTRITTVSVVCSLLTEGSGLILVQSRKATTNSILTSKKTQQNSVTKVSR